MDQEYKSNEDVDSYHENEVEVDVDLEQIEVGEKPVVVEDVDAEDDKALAPSTSTNYTDPLGGQHKLGASF